MRLLNAIEAGTTNATQLQTLINGDAGRLGDLRALFKLRGQCDRIKANPSVIAVLFGSASTLSAMQAVDTVNTRVYTPSFSDAATMGAIAASANAVTSIIGNATALATAVASSPAMAALAASATAVGLVSADSNANNLAIGSAYSVGAYLNTIIVNGGGASNATLAARTTMASTAGNATAMAAVAASTAAMNAVSKSANARTAIGTAGTGYDAIKTSNMAIGKLVAGLAGLDPTTYADMTAVANSAPARAAIGTAGSAYDAIAGSDSGVLRYALGVAGQNPSAFADAAAVAASAAACAAIFANATATTLIFGNAAASAAMFANATAKMAIFNSDSALNALAASAVAMAAARAAGGYAIKTWTENNGAAVAITGLAGTSYIILGTSRNNSNVRTHTVATLRSGTTISAVLNSDSVSDVNAMDMNCAIPVVAPFNITMSGGTGGTAYTGYLRCDA